MAYKAALFVFCMMIMAAWLNESGFYGQYFEAGTVEYSQEQGLTGTGKLGFQFSRLF